MRWIHRQQQTTKSIKMINFSIFYINKSIVIMYCLKSSPLFLVENYKKVLIKHQAPDIKAFKSYMKS